MPRFLVIIRLAAFALTLVPAAHAQRTTSVSAGYAQTRFAYTSATTGHRYQVAGMAPTVMLSAPGGSASVSLGGGTLQRPDVAQMLDVALSMGGDLRLVRPSTALSLSVHVPIRVVAGYRALPANATTGAPRLHLGNAGVGLGGGASLALPTGMPLLARRLVTSGSAVVSLGAMGEVASKLSPVVLTRMLDLNVEVKLERVLGLPLGLTAGYTFRTLHASAPVETLDHAKALARSPHTFAPMARQHLLRIGVNF